MNKTKRDVNELKSWTIKSSKINTKVGEKRILNLGDSRYYNVQLLIDGREVDLKSGPIFLDQIESKIEFSKANGYTESLDRFVKMADSGVTHVAKVNFVEK